MSKDGSDMKLGVIHYNFPGYSMEDFLSYSEETGFGHVELQIGDVWDEERPLAEAEEAARSLREDLDRHGLGVSALAARNDFVQLERDAIHHEAERMKSVCGLADILGTEVIRTEGGRPKDSVPEERWVEAVSGCLKACVPFIEENGFYLAVDNHGLVTNDGERQVEIFEEVGSDHVGANMDIMNYRWFGHPLDTVYRFYELIAPYTFHVHMKDGYGSRKDYVCTPLGEGELDVERAISELKRAGYDGVWCVEFEGREDPAVGYRKGLLYLKEHL